MMPLRTGVKLKSYYIRKAYIYIDKEFTKLLLSLSRNDFEEKIVFRIFTGTLKILFLLKKVY